MAPRVFDVSALLPTGADGDKEVAEAKRSVAELREMLQEEAQPPPATTPS